MDGLAPRCPKQNLTAVMENVYAQYTGSSEDQSHPFQRCRVTRLGILRWRTVQLGLASGVEICTAAGTSSAVQCFLSGGRYTTGGRDCSSTS